MLPPPQSGHSTVASPKKIPHVLLWSTSLYPQPQADSDLFSVSIVLPPSECHTNGSKQLVAFYIWFLSLSIMQLRFIHVVKCIRSSLPTLLSFSIVWTYYSRFIHSPVEEHLSYFQFLMIINKASVTFAYRCLNEDKFSFLLGKYLRMELLSCVISICLTLYEIVSCLPKCLCHFAFLPTMYESSN